MDTIQQASDEMNSTINELKRRVDLIRPTMVDMINHTRWLETELILICNGVEALEGKVDELERTMNSMATPN